MDFDEYDYLEQTVENPEAPNGGAGNGATEGGNDRKSSRHRSDGNDLDKPSKRVKSGEESRDHDRRREENSSRHRSRDDRQTRNGERSEKDRNESDRHRSGKEHKSGDRDRDRHKEERNGKERESDKDREKRQDKDRDRVREPDRESKREGREGDRSRDSRSSSERRRSDREKDAERERDKEKSREREKEREQERELREKERVSRRYKDKKENEPEADPERDQRTVFAYQIGLKADERDVYEFFSRAGKVRDVRLIMDRNSRRSKGVGYVEFYDAMSVPMAIALSGQPLLGNAVMVKPSEAEKNLVQSNTAVVGAGGIGPYSGGARRLYVGNLHFNITEDQLRQVFEPFGPLELVQLPIDQETGQCKGFGFVQFARLEDARAAESLNGQLEIAGRNIKVSAVSDQVGMQDIGATAGDFDDDDGGGLSLNARSRAMLMQKLDRSGATSSVNGSGLNMAAAPGHGMTPAINPLLASLGQSAAVPGAGLAVPVPPVDMIGVPSECLMLKNMFDPSVETEPDFDLDIKEDVQEECSKFGKLKHIYVDKNSAGHVYLRFENTEAAINSQRALHGRWFAGKMITATYMLPVNYEAKFPESK